MTEKTLRLTPLVLAVAAMVCAQSPASAISVELAKKCRAAALKAHPTAPPGSKSGSAKAQSEYYNACIARNGEGEN